MASVSSTSSSTTSSTNRLTGLSGFDTETVVEGLMSAERIPLDTLYQKRQLVEWRQEQYRDMTTVLKGLKSTYFDVLNKSSYMLGTDSLSARSVTSSDSAYATATATSEADLVSHTLKVNQLATTDKAVSSAAVTKGISGTVTSTSLSGQTLKLTLDGVTKTLTLADYDDTTIESSLQTAIDEAFGTTSTGGSKIDVAYSGGTLSLASASGTGKLTVAGGTGLTNLGLTSGASNRISTSGTLADLASSLGTAMTFDADGNASFSINGKSFSFASTTKLSTVFSTINSDADANVRISYSDSTDMITLASKQYGSGDNLQLEETGSTFFAALGIDVADPVTSEGVDAEVEIDGETVVRSSNTFTVDGVSYSLLKEQEAADDALTMSVTQDVDAAVEKITAFVTAFNSMIDTVYGKIDEDYDSDYPPLTDAQKEEMSDDEIANWETKAKTGLLRSDSILRSLMSDIRNAMVDKISGLGLSLKDIGLTSSSYEDNGKLTIDEDTLREALSDDPDSVMDLLGGVSSSEPTYSRTATSSERSTRYKESGILQRISDIIDDNISTYRDASGNKGILLEKAGITNDLSESDNSLSDELDDYDERIDKMLDRLDDKEEYYYSKFSSLETYLNQMNAQSSWISSMLGSS